MSAAIERGHLVLTAGTATDGTTGAVQPCRWAFCDCHGERGRGGHFLVFQVDGQTHLHLQCVDCGTSFCPGGIHATDVTPRPEAPR
jgi:hypothetical protein